MLGAGAYTVVSTSRSMVLRIGTYLKRSKDILYLILGNPDPCIWYSNIRRQYRKKKKIGTDRGIAVSASTGHCVPDT